ncbi:MAG: hypothetical protein IT469_07395 [Pseudomonadales bacterium]|nr:hypothetical protein [Pseudomonadales bacterium]
MNTKQSIETIVTDTNGRLRGVMGIQVEFHKGGPCEVIHAGQTYHATGKEGAHMTTGRLTREMATDDDARLWIALDGSHVWED